MSGTARVALLSNPHSTGNRALLPRIRSFCAHHPQIFHYEVEDIDQIDEALRTIAQVEPAVLVVNGGDGTVQAMLTALHHGGWFGDTPPPVAVLPNGKTNLIALDLGAEGDPIGTLERIIEIAHEGVGRHIVGRELIALSSGEEGQRDTLGMFLGGAGLADTMLYCRNKIYPLGLPNGLSHALTALAVVAALLFNLRATFLPPVPEHVEVSLLRSGTLQGRYAIMIVTTLQRMLVGTRNASEATAGVGGLKLMMVDNRFIAVVRALTAGMLGKLGTARQEGVHIGRGDEIRIEGARSSVILDGELFQAEVGRPIVLRPTAPVSFLRLAA